MLRPLVPAIELETGQTVHVTTAQNWCLTGRQGCRLKFKQFGSRKMTTRVWVRDFVWCHAGISRRIVVDDLVPIHAEILRRYGDHVYIDLSWVVFEDYIIQRDEERRIVLDGDGDPKIRPEWIELIEKYPDNFILGSDVVADFRKYHQSIRKYNALLKALEPKTRVKVGNRNFVRVMPKKGLTISHDYTYPESRFTRYKGPLEVAPDSSGNSLPELLSAPETSSRDRIEQIE